MSKEIIPLPLFVKIRRMIDEHSKLVTFLSKLVLPFRYFTLARNVLLSQSYVALMLGKSKMRSQAEVKNLIDKLESWREASQYHRWKEFSNITAAVSTRASMT